MNLVVVESPAKAKTIKKYLGADFEVLASYGHVRDLRPKEGAVEPNEGFVMHYEVIERNEKHVAALTKAMKKADALFLATDPDREGEAIAWHVAELLRERNLLVAKPVRRVVFHEITKRAILAAMDESREVSMDLVNAQQARRALDYLVGFNLSPLLWKKIRRGLSAGRVQSPALRMIAEREEEILRFVAREYWTLEADLQAEGGKFMARLNRYDSAKLEQFSITNETDAFAARDALLRLAGGELLVRTVQKKQRKRNPAPPFTTSTLQQEASRKLGFGAQRTMRTAQQLYEGIDTGSGSVGMITYMRTDSVTLAQEAVDELRQYIADQYGRDDVPEAPRQYKTKSRNAQEAHEAIRPTGFSRPPDSLKAHLSDDQFKLYTLIWRRTVACQMIHATVDTVAADLGCSDDSRHSFRANGSTVTNPGFLKVYEESLDDTKADDERTLPPLVEGDHITLEGIRSEQHFTEPPPRFSEASLVRTLEEYGIGRPSTYASIMSTLVQREYVELESRRFRPTDVGSLVSRFLTDHFDKYVDYDFTAHLEDDLDAVSRGEKEWVPLLEEFWQPFKDRIDDKEVSVSRKEAAQARDLGIDPKSGRPVSVRIGRFGPYAQIGVAEDEEKPLFAGLLSGQRMDALTLEQALELYRLPRDIGTTADGEPVSAGIGRFGPFVKFGRKYASLTADDDPYTVDIERALVLIEAKKIADAPIHSWEHEGKTLIVRNGRFGPYATDGEINASIPKKEDANVVTLARVLELLEKKRNAPPRPGRGKKVAAKQATAKKVAVKKVPAKKSASKKAARKKSTSKKTVTKKSTSKKTVTKKTLGSVDNAVSASET
jgi:DNA topoisomerase-1